MDHFVDERDFRLLEGDPYTFFVLSRVMGGPCACLRSDHERLILCHTTMPYPVWLWTADGMTPDELEQAWQLAAETCPLEQGYRYNLKYELADYFLKRAQETGLSARIETNMFAYDCPASIRPEGQPGGVLYRCTPEDAEEAAQMIWEFHEAIHADRTSRERCLTTALEHIEGGGFFLWKTPAGETVACCALRPDRHLGCVSCVYTRPAHRRQHHAQHMVWQLTRLIEEQGLTPMLYTDADYAASNACYEKIGYVLRGKLCTIGIGG